MNVESQSSETVQLLANEVKAQKSYSLNPLSISWSVRMRFLGLANVS